MAEPLGAARLNRAPRVSSGRISHIEESCCDMLLCDGVAPRRFGFVPVAVPYRLEALPGNRPERYRFKLDVLPRVATR